MSRVWHIARREWLEQARQPAMLAVIAALFVAIGGLVDVALWLLDATARRPAWRDGLATWAPALGLDPDGVVPAVAGGVVGIANWLVFTQFLGITAVLAGHVVLHDRQTGALPFLLLAPVRRAELLAGKVLGAIGPSLVLYVVVSGAATAIAASFEVTAPHRDRLPPSPAFLVAFLAGGPVWSAFVATLCAIVSSVARDVRTAQQAVWFVMFFATFACGFLLAALLPEGVAVQLAVAGLGAVATAGALLVGSRVISRDLGR